MDLLIGFFTGAGFSSLVITQDAYFTALFFSFVPILWSIKTINSWMGVEEIEYEDEEKEEEKEEKDEKEPSEKLVGKQEEEDNSGGNHMRNEATHPYKVSEFYVQLPEKK